MEFRPIDMLEGAHRYSPPVKPLCLTPNSISPTSVCPIDFGSGSGYLVVPQYQQKRKSTDIQTDPNKKQRII